MEVKEESKTVTLWLTREEKNDPAFRESLKPMYRKYGAAKYLVAVFLSGEEELYPRTRDLLLYNRRRLAEREVREYNAAELRGGSVCWRREITTIFCRAYLTNFCRKSRSQQNK